MNVDKLLALSYLIFCVARFTTASRTGFTEVAKFDNSTISQIRDEDLLRSLSSFVSVTNAVSWEDWWTYDGISGEYSDFRAEMFVFAPKLVLFPVSSPTCDRKR